MNPDDFARKVRRDDYAAHAASFVVACVSVLVSVLFESPWPAVVGMGGGLVASGFFAIRGGRSGITSISAPGFRQRWTTRELENMSPNERASHARFTGAFLIVLGMVIWGFGGYTAIEYTVAHVQADRTGSIRQVPGGNGLALADGNVVWGLTGAVGYATIPDGAAQTFVDPLLQVPRSFAANGPQLAVVGRGGVMSFVFTSGLLQFRASISGDNTFAVASHQGTLAWTDTKGVHLGSFERPGAKQLATEPIDYDVPQLLAVVGERVFYGPTERCGLAEVGHTECVAGRNPLPCALAHDAQRLAFVTEAGEAYLAEASADSMGAAERPFVVRQLSKDVADCGVAIDGAHVFVAGHDTLMRIGIAARRSEAIYELPERTSVTAAVARDGWVFFRSGASIHRVRVNAPRL